MKKRKIIDRILNITTYVFSSFGVIILIAIFAYVFINGAGSLSWDLLVSDYNEETFNVKRDDKDTIVFRDYEKPTEEGYFSTNWGITLRDGKNIDGNKVVIIDYVDELSPLNNMIDNETNSYVKIFSGEYVSKIVLSNDAGDYIYALDKDGAENMQKKLDQGTIITDMITKKSGGGIRGSLVTTLYLICLTLIIALPLGIGGAIYLNEYAKHNKVTHIIRAMIDMISGIPSIIFGFLGLFVFVPICDTLFHTHGGSIISGSLTLAVLLLPTIIKNTEESLLVIPESYRSASLALGASKTQTIFKVILPNAMGGILTSVLLSIGRIIGESAALIFAIGTTIKDNVSLTSSGTSLSVHIWVLMGGENPNFNTSCAIAIIILTIVLVLNISIKLFAKKLNRLGV